MSREQNDSLDATDSSGIETAYLHATNTPHVWKRTDGKGNFVLITEDGEIEPTIQNTIESVDENIHELWRLLGPVTIAGAEIKRNTKLYHTERECHLQAEEIRLNRNGVPRIMFRKIDFTPTEYIELTGNEIRKLRTHDTTCKLRTQEEIHDNITAALGMNTE